MGVREYALGPKAVPLSTPCGVPPGVIGTGRGVRRLRMRKTIVLSVLLLSFAAGLV
jgi:hypothetical protein